MRLPAVLRLRKKQFTPSQMPIMLSQTRSQPAQTKIWAYAQPALAISPEYPAHPATDNRLNATYLFVFSHLQYFLHPWHILRIKRSNYHRKSLLCRSLSNQEAGEKGKEEGTYATQRHTTAEEVCADRCFVPECGRGLSGARRSNTGHFRTKRRGDAMC